MSDPNTDAPEEQQNRPTVASVSAVASTTDDVEAANPTHPDRPVGVNVDTAGLGTGSDDTEDVLGAEDTDPEEGLGAETDAADSRDA